MRGHSIHRIRKLTLGLLIVAALPVARGNAQTAKSGELEEITVTAERRTERLQATPISISAFTAEALKDRGVDNVQDLRNFVPNLELNPGRADGGGSTAQATIRGIGQNDFLFPNDPGVGTYIDGVYVARTIGGLAGIVDIDRIEVLRGPQGTLYGRNTIGGAINFITSQPDGTLGGSAEANFGSYGRADAKASVQFPIVPDLLAAKISLGEIHADGWGKQVLTGVETGNEDKQVGRLALRYTPDPTIDVTLAGDYSRQRQNGAAGGITARFPSTSGLIEDLAPGFGYNSLIVPVYENPKFGLPADSRFDGRWITNDPEKDYGTAPTTDWYDIWGLSLTGQYRPSDAFSVKSITAYRALSYRIARDSDHTPYDIVGTDARGSQYQFSQEFQFSGKAIDDRLTWLVGLYYFYERAGDDNTVLLVDGYYQVTHIPGLDIDQDTIERLKTRNAAVFQQSSFKITDQLSLVFGARESYEHKKYVQFFTHPNEGDVFVDRTLNRDWTSFTPKVGLDYQLDPDVLLYFTYAEGFKSGGWNPRPTSGNAGTVAFNPETVETYEIGAKTEFFDHRLTVNVAAFLSEYDNIQLSVLQSERGSNGTFSIVTEIQNAGANEIKGFEIETVARPIPPLTAQLGLGYLDDHFTRINADSTIPISAKLPDAPKWTLNFGLDYSLPLGSFGDSAWRLDGAWKSPTWKDSLNSPSIRQGAYWLFNTRISVYPASLPDTEIAFSVKNLADKRYVTNAGHIDAFGYDETYWGRPREFNVSLHYKF